jgi:hypothetical protein
MKIAVCISGLPRSYKQGFEELKTHFLDKYDCDVYIHTWYDITSTYETGHKFAPKAYYNFTKKDYQNILDLYKPLSYEFQKPIPFDCNNIKGPHLGYKLHNILSAAYSAHACFNLLKESKKEYDLIIRYRFDLQFTNYVSPECVFLKDITKIDPSKLSIFKYPDDENGYPTRPCEMDDIFAVGGYEVMDKFYLYFSYILYYIYMDKDYRNWLETYVDNPDGLSAEPVLKWHLINNNVEFNLVESGVDHWYTAGIIR